MKKILLTACVLVIAMFAFACNVTDATYQVVFECNEAAEIPAQTVKFGETATQPQDPTQEHYDFEGWYNGETPYDFSQPVTADLTLTAKWAITQYEVTFNSDGGSEVSAQTVDALTAVSQPESVTKSGFTFLYWALDGVKYDFAKPITQPITLSAVWEKDVEYSQLVGTWTGEELLAGAPFATWTLTFFVDGSVDAYADMMGSKVPVAVNSVTIQGKTVTVNYDSNKTLNLTYADGALTCVGPYSNAPMTLTPAQLNSENFIGTWKGTESYEGMPIEYTFMIESQAFLAKFDMFGSEEKLELVSFDNKLVLSYNGLKLVFVYDGEKFIGTGVMGGAMTVEKGDKNVLMTEATLQSIAGTWTATEEFYGYTFEYTFVINADGTGDAYYASSAETTTLTILSYSVAKGKLTVKYQTATIDYPDMIFNIFTNGTMEGTGPMGTTLVLTKQAEEVTVADLAGTWKGTSSAYGIETEYTFVINADGTGSGKYSMMGSDSEFTDVTFTLSEGKLVVNYKSYGQGYTMTFTVNADGTMSTDKATMDETLTIAKA